jgi:hypothetical protein
MDVDAGFDTDRTVTMRVSLPQSRYARPEQRVQFFRRLLERVEQVPEVQSAGAVSFLPLTGLGAATRYAVLGEPEPAAGQEPVTDVRVITKGYFKSKRPGRHDLWNTGGWSDRGTGRRSS